MVGGDVPFYLKFLDKMTYTPCKSGNFQLILARSTSVMTPSKKSSIITRDVTEPAKIRIRRMQISCAKSVGCGLRAQN